MSSSIVLTVKSEFTQAANQTLLQLNSNKSREVALNLSALFKSMASKNHRGIVDIQTGAVAPVAASATLTLNTVIATDVFVVGPVTFTGTATPTTELHFDTDAGSDTLIAADIAAKINAHSTVGQVVTATSAAAIVTVTANQSGVSGNFINISSVDTTITASADNLEDGLGGATEAASQYSLGLS